MIGYLRLICSNLIDLDVISSPRCPQQVLDWYNKTKNVVETERIVIDRHYRRYHLMPYLFYLGASYIINPINKVPCRNLIGTFGVPQLVRFGKNMGSYVNPDWTIRYSENDEPSQILTFDYSHIKDNEQLLNCLITKAKL